MYIKKDHNGGLNISYQLITVILTVLMIIASIVGFSVGVRADVDNLNEKVENIQLDVNDLKVWVSDHRESNARIETKLENLQENLVNIKKILEDK